MRRKAMRPSGGQARAVMEASVVSAVAFAALFGALVAIVHDAPAPALDTWFDAHVRRVQDSPLLETSEHLAGLPGSREGVALIALAVGA